MQHQEHSYLSKDGLKIYAQSWSVEQPKAVVCIAHGMGEHSGRYLNVVNFLNKNQYTVFALDHRGHGKSEGKRGHTPAYNSLMDDMAVFLEQADKIFPSVPKILYGHSMGGNVVLNFVLKNNPEIKAVISSSALLKLAFEPPAFQIALGKMVKSIFPAFSQNTNLDASAISRDKVVVEAYQKDPLVHGKISATFFLEMMDAAKYALDNAEKMKYPLLIFHGDADRLTASKGSEEFASKIKNNINFKLFSVSFHEIHNDINQDELFDWMKKWLDTLN